MEPFTNGEWLVRDSDSRAFRVQRVSCGTGVGLPVVPAKGFPGGLGAADGPGAARAGVKVSRLLGTAPSRQVKQWQSLGCLGGGRGSSKVGNRVGPWGGGHGRDKRRPGESQLVLGAWSCLPVLQLAARMPFRNRAGWGCGAGRVI